MRGTELFQRLVSDVLAETPAAAGVFVDRAMGCPGCPFARFETIAEVAHIYGIDASDLAASVARAIAAVAIEER